MEAEGLANQARGEAERQLATAKEKSQKQLAKAKDDAEHLLANAREESNRMLAKTQEEARSLTEQLAMERAAVDQQRNAVEHREQEVLALMEEVETKEGGAAAGQRSGCESSALKTNAKVHAAVATFWANLHHADNSEPECRSATVSTDSPLQAERTAADSGRSGASAPPQAASEANEDEPVTRAAAMKEALAAARAEVEAANKEEQPPAEPVTSEESDTGGKSPGPKNAPKFSPAKVQATGVKQPQSPKPVKVTRDTLSGKSHRLGKKSAKGKPAQNGPEPEDGPESARTASVDLDAETADKLRMLRRLNPHRSEAELLGMLAARLEKQVNPPEDGNRKKRWFARR